MKFNLTYSPGVIHLLGHFVLWFDPSGFLLLFLLFFFLVLQDKLLACVISK